MQRLTQIVLHSIVAPEALNAASSGNAIGVIIVIDYFCLLVASVIGLAVIIERMVRLRDRKVLDRDLAGRVENLVSGGETEAVVSACRENGTVLGKALAREFGEVAAGNTTTEEAIQVAGEDVDDNLQANLDILGTVAKVAPLLGLLGTVLGMMYAFGQLDLGTRKETLAHGITAALDTTVRGLIIAIVTLTAEQFFRRRIDQLERTFGTVFTSILRAARRSSGVNA